MNGPKLRRDLTLVPHSAQCVEIRIGAWNATSITIEWETGNLLNFLRALDGNTSIGEATNLSQALTKDAEDLVIKLQQYGLLSRETDLDSMEVYIASSALAYGSSSASLGSPRSIAVVGEGIAGQAILTTLTNAKLDVVQLSKATLGQIVRDASDWLSDGLEFERKVARLKDEVGDRFIVYAPDHVNPAHASILGHLCHASGTAWMHSVIDGPLIMIGPIFLPDAFPCYGCFETRVLMNLRNAHSYVRYKEILLSGEILEGVSMTPPVIASLHASLVSAEACHYAYTGTGFTFKKCLTLYIPTFEFSFNEILPVASCHVCGITPERDSSGLYGDLSAYGGF